VRWGAAADGGQHRYRARNFNFSRRDTSMNHKALLGTAVAAALMFGAQAASACAITAWSSATGLTAADVGLPSAGFSRVLGECSLKVADSNGASGRFVTDTTPNNETSYRVRFYYFTGGLSGTAAIFQARNTGGTNIIQVTHNGSQLSFTVNGVGAPQTVNVQANRYYSIELAWAAAAGTGSMTGTVSGASGAAITNAVAGTVNFANLNNSADSITEARMGLINGSVTTGGAPVFFDEFDSRRTTNPGLLCRGDAGGGAGGAPDGVIGSADRVLITNEILGTNAQPKGYPDASQDGLTASADRVAVTNMILAGTTCN
jgi:hypothetical protein